MQFNFKLGNRSRKLLNIKQGMPSQATVDAIKRKMYEPMYTPVCIFMGLHNILKNNTTSGHANKFSK